MTILDEIMQKTAADVEVRKQQIPLAELEQKALARQEGSSGIKDFFGALKKQQDHANVIAELKKASPSKGLIRPDFRPLEFCVELEEAGAVALSCLTEPHWFKGSLEFLDGVTQKVNIPVLRKDFICDPFQIVEAKAYGASAILLIAAALSPQEYRSLFEFARKQGLHVLTEVHNREELDMVLGEGAQVVGINARNLKTFAVDLAIVEDLLAHIPSELVGVAESGISGAQDIARLQKAGAGAFLIGETIMRTGSPGDNLRTLLGVSK